LLIPILMAVAGILVVASLSGSLPQAIESPFSALLAPLQQAVSSLGDAIGGQLRGATDTQNLRQQVEALQQRVDELTVENVRLREFQAEVKQYRDLLKFANDNPVFGILGADVVGIGNAACGGAGLCASVIGADPSPFLRYVTINAGRRQGIQVGMPVVGGGLALVGRVGQVGEASSQVQLLVDPNSYVNVLSVETRATGTVAGQPDGSLRLVNVPQTDKLDPQNLIVTSGLGGALPRLLPVGQVDRIVSSDAQLFKEALLRPAVDFNRIEVVVVITSTSTVSPTR
jgi:rod shape-determining protein MreC